MTRRAAASTSQPCSGCLAAKAERTRSMAASRARATIWKISSYFRRDRGADEADAGQVAVDGAGLVELGPEVDQDEVALADRGVVVGPGLVMRVAAVRADGDDRRRIGRQAVLLEVVEDRRLHLGLADAAAVARAVGDQAPGPRIARAGVDLRLAVHPPLVVVPGRLEALDQVARGDDLGAASADELDGAGIDPGDVRVAAPRGILHRHPAPPGNQRPPRPPPTPASACRSAARPAGGRALPVRSGAPASAALRARGSRRGIAACRPASPSRPSTRRASRLLPRKS